LAKPVLGVGILDRGEPLTLDALQNVKRVVGLWFSSADKECARCGRSSGPRIGRSFLRSHRLLPRTLRPPTKFTLSR
jgi:hypothetical protein